MGLFIQPQVLIPCVGQYLILSLRRQKHYLNHKGGPFAAHYKRHSSARGRKAKLLGPLSASVTVDGDSRVCREAAPGLGRWRVRAEGEAGFIDPD